MGRFDQIIDNFVRWGNNEDRLCAALIIGSQARSGHPADEFSDLDMVLVVDEPEVFLETDGWLQEIGDYYISFVENTLGGGRERRVLFDGALDVDFCIFSRDCLVGIADGSFDEILGRGYMVLIDKIGLWKTLPEGADQIRPYHLLTEQEFKNAVNDFWYHAVWTAKKVIRGELWTAISCLDNYMKWILLKLIECHTHIIRGKDADTWHNGRFLEEWAEGWIVRKLSGCYSHYNAADIKRKLLETMELFRAVAAETAEKLHYEYPAEADRYSTGWVEEALQKNTVSG